MKHDKIYARKKQRHTLTSMVLTFLLKKMFHMKNKKRMIVLKTSPNSQEKRAKLIDRSIWNKTNPFTKLISYVKSQVKWKPIRFHMKKDEFFWENFIWNQIIFHMKNWLFLKHTKIDVPHNIILPLYLVGENLLTEFFTWKTKKHNENNKKNLSSIVEKSVHHLMINKKLKLTPEEIPKIRFIVVFLTPLQIDQNFLVTNNKISFENKQRWMFHMKKYSKDVKLFSYAKHFIWKRRTW